MVKRVHHRRRDGTILPMLAVCLIGLFGFIGLAVDLGLLAVSRTQSQNAADTAALTACRLLNQKPGTVNSNLANAVAAGKTRVTSNKYMSQNFATAQISKIEAGQYLYDTTAQIFRVAAWTDVTGNQSATPSGGGSWTAIKVTLALNQPTYFMRVFGVNGMPTGAKATAVFKPRDVAFVIDMTGSMGNGSIFNYNSRSHNPDDMVPNFGHYVNVPGGNGSGSTALRSAANQVDGTGQAIPMNNFVVATNGGPPIIRDFYYDPANLNSPATEAFPITANTSTLRNAFHRWSPAESGGDQATSTPVTYDFSGYNVNTAATPAPYSFGNMTDTDSRQAASIPYVGDPWRRVDGSINKLDNTWTGSANRAAINVADLLGYTVSSGKIGTVPVTQFRDPIWEKYGYDLDIKQYRTTRNSATNPMDPDAFSTLLPAADRLKGYSMGPGYWGKTFFIWPPDPRTPVGNIGDANYVAGDWRLRFFHRNNGTTWGTDYSTNPLDTTNTPNGINAYLMSTGAGPVLNTGTGNFIPDYVAILKWIKSGPQVFPPNLRAGHVLYYTSIPDDVDTSTGTTQTKLDKGWWKGYIDYVLSYGLNDTGHLYGRADSWSLTGAGRTINNSALQNQWKGPNNNWDTTFPAEYAKYPYMAYSDSPNRPRLHFWFGPLSMVDFMQLKGNWLPGTSHEAHCWQLKAGMSSVLEDVKNNRPNNYVGMTYFSTQFNGIRRPMGQKFDSLRRALFYPKSLLDTIDLENGGTSVTCEKRPYTNTSLSSVSGDEIPSSGGGTDPSAGFVYGFNLLSPSASLPSQYGTATNKGRRGAAKLVIFETDGCPNNYRTANFNTAGYNSYYSPCGGATGIYYSNADEFVAGIPVAGNQYTIPIVEQMVKQMSTTTGGDSGLSLPNAPCRVYPIAFGDLFDTQLAPTASTLRNGGLKFLADIAYKGNTGPQSASYGGAAATIPTQQQITGSYQTRIDTLRLCMENIFQSGVGVTLVE